MKNSLFIILIFTLLPLYLLSQENNKETINFTDVKGLKQGKWEKIYPNGNTAYSAFFVNDRLVGEMIRFHENGQLMATVKYDEQGIEGFGILYNEKGQKIAEGGYKGTNKEGEWFFFNDAGQLISKEIYVNNKRHGKTESYYPNGDILELGFRKEDMKVGDEIHYYPEGSQRLRISYRILNNRSVMHGPYIVFFDNGNKEIEGKYLYGKPDGEWVFYKQDGEIDYKIQYINGVLKDSSFLDKRQEERFKEFEENRGKLKDPQDFTDDPDGYMMGQ